MVKLCMDSFCLSIPQKHVSVTVSELLIMKLSIQLYIIQLNMKKLVITLLFLLVIVIRFLIIALLCITEDTFLLKSILITIRQ